MANEQQDRGAWEQAKGAVKEGVGKATGNDKMEWEGKAEQATGDVREHVGDAQQKVHEETGR